MTRSLARTVAAAVFDAIESAHLHSGAISLSTVESAVEAALVEYNRPPLKQHDIVVLLGNSAAYGYMDYQPVATSVAGTTISCGDAINSNWHTYTVGPVSHIQAFVTDDKSCLPTIVNPK